MHLLGRGARLRDDGSAPSRAPHMQEFCIGRAAAASRLPASTSIYVGRPSRLITSSVAARSQKLHRTRFCGVYGCALEPRATSEGRSRLVTSPVRRGSPAESVAPCAFCARSECKSFTWKARTRRHRPWGQALIRMLRGGALGVDSPCARKTVGSPQQFGSENRPIVAVIQLCTAADWWGVPTIFAAGRVTRLALSKPRSPGSTVKRSSQAARCDQS